MSTNSWSHRLVRPVARLLIGTRLTPDHLTWLRVITGGIACACFACTSQGAQTAGGVFWTISALLDRADGELARLSNSTSAMGHRFDMLADTGVNTAMFIAVGIGLREGALGYWAIILGGAGGFDPDDLFYLVGPFAWAGILDFMLVSGTLVLPPATTAIGVWRWRAARRARAFGG